MPARRRPLLCLLAGLLALLGAGPLSVMRADASTEITILSYNIIAIPCLAKDDPTLGLAKLVMDVKTCSPNPTWYGRNMAKRMKVLERFLRRQASQANGADVVVLQEAYTSRADVFEDGPLQSVIRSGAYPYVATGAPSVLGNDAASLIELARHNTVDDPPRGAFSSGLVVFSRLPILTTRTVDYGRDCTLDDCGSNKGALFLRLRLPDGDTAELYVTHMQANDKAEKVRQRQIATFGRFVEATGGKSPYRFYVGDFNFKDQAATPSFGKFRRMTGAEDAGQACLASPDCRVRPDEGNARRKAGGRSLDHQFFKATADGYLIEPTLVRFDDVMVEGKALSDHQNLAVRYRLTSP